MIKLDYSKIPEKLKELDVLKAEFEKEVEELTKDKKAEAEVHFQNRDLLYNYQRAIMDYFELYEQLLELEKQEEILKKNSKEVNKIDDAFLEQLNNVKQAYLSPDVKVQTTAQIAYNMIRPYLNNTAQRLGKAYQEWTKNPVDRWEDKPEAKQAMQLIAINKLMTEGFKIWNNSKSINVMKTQALDNLNAMKACINEIYDVKQKEYVDYRLEKSKKLSGLKGAIEHMQELIKVKQQSIVLVDVDRMLDEKDRGNLELESYQYVKDLKV